MDVGPIRRRGNGQTEVVHVREGEIAGDLAVKAGIINNKQQRRDRGPLGGAHRDWGKHFGEPLVKEPARPARKKRLGPGHKIRADPHVSNHAAEREGVDILAATFYVKKQCGDLPSSHLEGLYLVGEGGDWVRGRETGQRAALVGIEEAGRPGHPGESLVHTPLKDFRESLEQD